MTTSEALPSIDDLWDFQNPAITEARFRELLPQAQEHADRVYEAELLTQIARTEGLQRRFDDAHRTLDAADALVDGASRARLRTLLERGRVFNSAGHRDLARPQFVEAWELGQAIGEPYYAVDAAHMLAIVDPPEDRLPWYEQALSLATTSDDPRAATWLGSLYNNLGWALHDVPRFDEALIAFRKAVDWQGVHGTARDLCIAHWAVARCLRSLGQYDAAITIQRDNLASAASIGETDGYIDEELGECLLALGRHDEARPHLARAWELLSQDDWLVHNEPERLARLKSLMD